MNTDPDVLESVLTELEAEGFPPLPSLSADQADRYMRAIAHYQRTLDHLGEWYQHQAGRVQAKIQWLSEQVESFAVAARRETGMATFKLASGIIRTTRRRPRVEMTSIDEFREFFGREYPATKHPELYRLDERLAKEILEWEQVDHGEAAACDPEGVLVPGIRRIVPDKDDVSVSIKPHFDND